LLIWELEGVGSVVEAASFCVGIALLRGCFDASKGTAVVVVLLDEADGAGLVKIGVLHLYVEDAVEVTTSMQEPAPTQHGAEFFEPVRQTSPRA
jgi:hypothetical protein